MWGAHDGGDADVGIDGSKPLTPLHWDPMLFTGDCTDDICKQHKDKIWKGALYVLYASAAWDGLKTANEDTEHFISKLRDLLPGVRPLRCTGRAGTALPCRARAHADALRP